MLIQNDLSNYKLDSVEVRVCTEASVYRAREWQKQIDRYTSNLVPMVAVI